MKAFVTIRLQLHKALYGQDDEIMTAYSIISTLMGDLEYMIEP